MKHIFILFLHLCHNKNKKNVIDLNVCSYSLLILFLCSFCTQLNFLEFIYELVLGVRKMESMVCVISVLILLCGRGLFLVFVLSCRRDLKICIFGSFLWPITVFRLRVWIFIILRISEIDINWHDKNHMVN